MEECCPPGTEPSLKTNDLACPSCGHNGRDLDEITLRALLQPEALARLGECEHRFCPSPGCPVVYFGRVETFHKGDVVAPVFQKEPPGDRVVCHCFGIDEETIRQEIDSSGLSPSAERIRVLVQAGRCACEVRNPQGTCCLGNVAAVVASARARFDPQASPVTA
jgi:hypothetical protein